MPLPECEYNPVAWEDRPLDEHYERLGWAPNRLNMIDWITSIAPSSMLDVGCLDGGNIQRLRQLGFRGAYLGIDITRSFNAKAQRRVPGERFQTGDVRAMDFGNDAFDLVLVSDVLLHLPDLAPPMQECFRVASNHLLLSIYGSRTETFSRHGAFLNTSYSRRDVERVVPGGWQVDEFVEFPHPEHGPAHDTAIFQWRIRRS